MNKKLIKNPVLGAICGDMIGVPYEFRKSKAEENFPLWSEHSHFSDDTVMTIAVAEWLLYPPYNTYNLTSIMQKWGRRYRNAGYGHLFGKWIDSNNPKPYNSFGNGSAMRVSPVGCAFNTRETTLIMAEQSASVSHNHPEGIKGAKCVADLIFRILQYDDWETKEKPYKEVIMSHESTEGKSAECRPEPLIYVFFEMKQRDGEYPYRQQHIHANERNSGQSSRAYAPGKSTQTYCHIASDDSGFRLFVSRGV